MVRVTTSLAAAALALFLVVTPAAAQTPSPSGGILAPFQRVGNAFIPTQGTESYNATTATVVIGQILSVLLGFLGVLFVALTIYGGFLWMTARGNSKQVEDSQVLIRNSVIGIIVILSAFAISRTVLTELSYIFAPGQLQ